MTAGGEGDRRQNNSAGSEVGTSIKKCRRAEPGACNTGKQNDEDAFLLL